ncbi:replicative DNA helicase [Serinicoccus sp. CUA-874]|uniref:replicative DNA helicase n=1 Tax=Serinicoccus sp. CUA-874 TaxID=1517939 RepID=UPI00095C47F7|nr:replicative DNA helicase [Serinicoccus sp. CUA-874]OLT17771.1 replicative DNA helicase [Serinicoccus sp. CUA-874]
MTLSEMDVYGPPDQGAPSGPEDRLPPQDVAAERSALGSMMLSKDAIAECSEMVKAQDFYRPAHEGIFEACVDLYSRGEPVDAITVGDELTKRGDLQRIGGTAYLHQLIAEVPTAANAAFYAEIVAERAVLRRLVDAGTRIVQIGYQGGDVEDIVNAAQAEVYAVADKRGGEDYQALGMLIEPTMDEIEHAAGSSGEMTGVPTGFTELDELTNGLHPGQMVIIAARPAVGKSTIALDFARAAAIKHQMATVVFSLEMSRTEITMRLLSAESEIPLQNMRKGNMRDRDWTRLAETQGRITDAPLFIDDSPNMSLMEIRAKCRRLKQRNNLKLVIIDYLQLMSSGKRVESRQQEVAEFSRALKLLAKELEVPVIALSQLNRGPEQRTDKKPQMSDLRESGCLTADTRVLRADTGAEVTLGELHEQGATDVPVWSLDESLRYVRRHLTHVFATGTRPVFRLTLTSGKTLTATENHPFLAYDGWKALGDLHAGDRIAVPRHVPAPERHEPWADDADVVSLADDLVEGRASRLPDEAWFMSKRQIAVLVAAMWAREGQVGVSPHEERPTISLPGNPSVLDQIARQLLRFGISTEQRRSVAGAVLGVVEWDDQRRFLQEVAPHGDLGPDVAGALALVRNGAGHAAAPRLSEPSPLWAEVGKVMRRAEDAGSLSSVVDVLDKEELDLAAVNDVLFGQIQSVELVGVEEVYDATVLGGHNFVANGIAVHNSIEQDADVVILLHRESLYERESPREGEADVIVAKHRNGPTDTVVVAFQGHYSRFTNMASNF